MGVRPVLAVFTASAALAWQAGAPSGTKPRPKPSDYPVHTLSDGLAVAAEYTVRSIGGGQEMFAVPGHLCFEVAVYPPEGGAAQISTPSFTLRVNGKKQLLFAQTPGMAAAALKYSDWEGPRAVEIAGGVGDGGVVIGRRRREPRFPGDPTDRRERVPAPQRQTQPSEASITAEQAVVEWALPDGRASGPVSGYVYFPFRGKPRKIKSLELIYGAGAEAITLRVF